MPPSRTRPNPATGSGSSTKQQPARLQKRDCNRQTQTQTQTQTQPQMTSTRLVRDNSGRLVPVRVSLAPPPPKVLATRFAWQAGENTRAQVKQAQTQMQQSQIIELSSDDEDEPPRRRPEQAPVKAMTAAEPKRCESQSRRTNPENESVLRQLEEVKRECERYKGLYLSEETKKDEALLRVQVAENNLQHEARNHPAPDYTELDEATTCEICTQRMWRPATLRECGHTFCETCLRDWFNTTYTAHVGANPLFLEGPPIPVHYAMHAHDARFAVAIEGIREEWRRRVPQPVYTCPTCRVHVMQSPLGIYFLREVVRKVARLVCGEGEGEREGSPGEEARMNPEVGSMWDGFFPKER